MAKLPLTDADRQFLAYRRHRRRAGTWTRTALLATAGIGAAIVLLTLEKTEQPFHLDHNSRLYTAGTILLLMATTWWVLHRADRATETAFRHLAASLTPPPPTEHLDTDNPCALGCIGELPE